MTDSTQASAPEATTSAATDVQSGATVETPEQAPATTETPAPEKTDGDGQPQGAPEDYTDFKLADGAELDAEVLTSFKGIAKELGISQEAAQKLIDLQGQLDSKRMQALEAAQAEQSQRWADAVKADKELGGENYDKTVETAIKAVEKFGSPELRALLNETGIGNHPELVKFCHRIGKALSEDSLVMGGDQKPGARTADVLFGDIN
ncbi:hypothetical protein AUR59_020125 [Stutzerimonas balearica]|uniref:hypothetical protein n=1 Tax=Stutzerimonas balearica TaxID=74829 RepID=UPI0009703B63|nr:hypothetical protein [Stutzerimonas balearica]OMG61471.1 hypothetical protein AUR59_020125 [Stutzerimonas balearica]